MCELLTQKVDREVKLFSVWYIFLEIIAIL